MQTDLYYTDITDANLMLPNCIGAKESSIREPVFTVTYVTCTWYLALKCRMNTILLLQTLDILITVPTRFPITPMSTENMNNLSKEIGPTSPKHTKLTDYKSIVLTSF